MLTCLVSTHREINWPGSCEKKNLTHTFQRLANPEMFCKTESPLCSTSSLSLALCSAFSFSFHIFSPSGCIKDLACPDTDKMVTLRHWSTIFSSRLSKESHIACPPTFLGFTGLSVEKLESRAITKDPSYVKTKILLLQLEPGPDK